MNHLRIEKRGAVGIVTFSRPEALNALNLETLKELDALLDEIATDSTLGIVIFTGEGKAFIAGADIKEMSVLNAEEGRAFGVLGQRIFYKLERLDQVTIAAVNGFALGGGCELALACDLRYAGAKAKMGQPEVTLGITPGFSGSQRLPKLIGLARAKELIFTGKMIGAVEAEQMGLVNKVVDGDVLEYAIEVASTIERNAPLAVKYSKKAIDSGYGQTVNEGNVLEAGFFGLCFASEDQKEGMSAFINKQKPNFKGI
jgi:enoyl-CoA hydratase